MSAAETTTGVSSGRPATAAALRLTFPATVPAASIGTVSLVGSPNSSSSAAHHRRCRISRRPASAASVCSLTSSSESLYRSQSASVTTRSIRSYTSGLFRMNQRNLAGANRKDGSLPVVSKTRLPIASSMAAPSKTALRSTFGPA